MEKADIDQACDRIGVLCSMEEAWADYSRAFHAWERVAEKDEPQARALRDAAWAKYCKIQHDADTTHRKA